MRICRVPNRRARRGAQTVEFALVLPGFVTVMMGLVEVGRGFMVGGLLATLAVGTIELTRLVQVKHTLTCCAREVCRRAIMPGATDSNIQTNVTSILTANRVAYRDVTITVKVNGAVASIGTAKSGDTVA